VLPQVSSAIHCISDQVPSVRRHDGEERLYHRGQLGASEFPKTSHYVHKPQVHEKGQLDPTRGATSY
jgi:hypothetical protein